MPKALIVLFVCISLLTNAQDLVRKGSTGFGSQYSQADGGAKVVRVVAGSPAEKAGLKVGDIILEIDRQPITDGIMLTRKISVIKTGQKLDLRVSRGGNTSNIIVTPASVPLEKNRNKTEYGVVTSDGRHLRTITTVPQGSGRRPAVLFIQWLSCGTLEIPGKSTEATDSLFKSFANSDKVIFVRVERPGTGDSEGGPCVDLTLEEELNAYRSALAQLKQRPDVDANKIFLLGLSLGSSLAPVVGEGQNIAGYMVSGACTQTWFEHMLDIERRRLKFEGTSPSEVVVAIKKFTKFYEKYLIEKMTPKQIEEAHPDLRGLWYDSPEHQYGRPAKFYMSVQDLNIEGAWEKVNVPVLVVFPELDWIMSRTDHQRIVDIVNARRPGLATFVSMEGLGHSLDRFKSIEDAYQFKDPVIDGTPNPVFLQWLDKQLQKMQ